MEKWAIRPDPSPFDPRRHVLLVQGNMKDISGILRKFGAVCGRPAAVRMPEGFNYSLILHAMTQADIERMSAALNDMSGALLPPAASMPPMSIPAWEPPSPTPSPETPTIGGFENGPGPSLPPSVALSAEEAAPSESLPGFGPPPSPVEPVAPAVPPAEGLFEAPLDKAALPTEHAQLGAGPELPPAPPAPAEAAPSELVSLDPASPPSKEPTPAPIAEPAAAAPASAAAPIQVEAAPALPAKPLWGLAIPLNPDCTFDTLLVGPYNRFAHAAATSVVGSPGSMYNPLFLYGASGVGKTHVAFSIAHGLAAAMTPDEVLMTSGSRLARAVSAALDEGRLNELERFIAGHKALIVDDIHLLAVSDANRQPLAKIFEMFFGKGLQVALTSIYPARALGALEEALKISLGKGWSVDLKVPSQSVQLELLQAYFDKNGLMSTLETTKLFHEKMMGAYADWKRWALRLKAMQRLAQSAGQDPKIEELIPELFDFGAASGASDFPTPQDMESAKGFAPPAAAADALNLAILLPRGQEAMGAWIIMSFHEAARRFSIPRKYRHVMVETYDAGQPFGVPFQIGDLCSRAAAQAALIVGPPADSNLSARVAEFSHAVEHILGSLEVAMGWIPHNGTTSAKHFLRAHLDFMTLAP